ncbi:MAG: GNAT family N-acetyltransferase [bacterium]|nr:GNAT family N-acetyltransferase [Acidimicrobiia bacterium]MCY4648759.1 GNAT family N-acetyltransferase [bacterium]
MDVRIRAAESGDVPAMARVYVDAWRTTNAGILPSEYLDGLSYRKAELKWYRVLADHQDTPKYFVAETHVGKVVGLAGGGPEREGNPTYRAELYLIYLLAGYQRQGLGRLLVSAVAEESRANGFHSMLVWTFKDTHGACRFYKSLGGELIGSGTITIGGRDVTEVCYGWRNIADLAANQSQEHKGLWNTPHLQDGHRQSLETSSSN